MPITADYELANRLILNSRTWVRELDALDNRQLLSLYYVDTRELDPMHWSKWDMLMKNIQLIMRLRFANAVQQGLL